MKIKKVLLIFVLCLLCFSPVLVNAKIGNYGIFNNNNNKVVKNDKTIVDDIDNVSNNVSTSFDINKSRDALIMFLIIFGSFAATSGLIYKFVLGKE